MSAVFILSAHIDTHYHQNGPVDEFLWGQWNYQLSVGKIIFILA